MRRVPVALAAACALLWAGTAAHAAEIWFAPLPRMPTHPGRPYIGSMDFMKLFSPGAPWKQAARQVAVFKLYGEWVGSVATDAQLRRVVADLKRRGMPIAVEQGPLVATAACGTGIEGFSGPNPGLWIAHRIEKAGGVIRYVALDEPFFYGSLYSGPKACRWRAERVAGQVASFVRAMRSVFPGVVVGDTEPLTSSEDVERYEQWLDAYRRVVGKNLAFIHLDMSYGLPGWPALARELESFARSRGVDFGMIYFGEPEDRSDAVWLARAQARFETYETAGGGRPDHVLLQSWQDRPDHVLPERNPARYASLVNRYARPRPELSLAVSGSGAAGRITDERGRPLAGTRIEVTVTPWYEGSALASDPVLELSATTDDSGAFSVALPGLPPIGVSVEARYAGSGALWPAFAAFPVGAAGRNAALGRPVTASQAVQSPAELAVDGSYDTSWGAGDGPPQWIEVDLGAPVAIGQIRLVTAQYPAGKTRHVVLGRGAEGTLRVLHEFSGATADAEMLEFTPPEPWAGIRAIRVETAASPSWVAWREIEVWSWP